MREDYENDIEDCKKIEHSDVKREAKLVALGSRIAFEKVIKDKKKKEWVNPNW